MELDCSTHADGEAQLSQTDDKRGGWITAPFILANLAGMALAGGGWVFNLTVYLTGEFNMKSIDAAQVFNIVNGCTNLIPVLGAIIADSFLGCFSVVWISSFISLLGTVLLALTGMLSSLRPQPCGNGSSLCTTPSKLQFAVLFSGMALACIGQGGLRTTASTMGANQFDKSKDQGIFFNSYFVTLYVASVVANIAIVYVEDNASWTWGFGICVAANLLALAIFLLGSRFYRRVKPEGSPFTGLARVVVAAIRKRKVLLSSKTEDYCHRHDGMTKMVAATPTKSFRFLNHAALKTEGDTHLSDGSIAKPWKLCTVQQVEDLKTLIKIFPLWSTSIFLHTPIGVQASLAVLQALAMDRHIGPRFQFPAGSILFFALVSASICISLLDRFLWPLWEKLTHRSTTPLQRIGVGHVINVLSMTVSALVESKRRNIAQSHHLQDQPGSIVPMSVLWLVPQLVLVGIGEAFHFPAQVALFYQEFPTSLKSLATAIVGILVGIAFYMSTAVINCVQKATDWLPNNINDGKLDNVFWMLVVVGVVNFGYYLGCAFLYKYQNLEKVVDSSST